MYRSNLSEAWVTTLQSSNTSRCRFHLSSRVFWIFSHTGPPNLVVEVRVFFAFSDSLLVLGPPNYYDLISFFEAILFEF